MTEPEPVQAPQPSPATSPVEDKRPLLPWGLLIASGLILIVVSIMALQARGNARDLQTKLQERGQELDKQKKELDKLQATHRAAEAKSQSLEADSAKLATELAATKAETEAAKAAFDGAIAELRKELAAEIRRGEIFVQDKSTGLVVDVSDKVLFDTGAVDINDRGKSVLKQVARSLSRVRGRVFQIGGHTDSEPIVSAEVKERFPTNWELSSARATNVVRFLAEKCGVPGERLIAAGFARYRPVAPNTTEDNKARNRRIEITVLREQK